MVAKNGPTSIGKKQIIGMAEKEMEYRVELFNRLAKTCIDKCIEKRYKESELYIRIKGVEVPGTFPAQE